MSRTKVESVSCTANGKKVDCNIVPGFDCNMCDDKILKRLGFKIDRQISVKDQDSKFFREITTNPIGWATISLTFTSDKKTRSITTETEVLVIKHQSNFDDEILLGSPWFIGQSLTDEELKIYDVKIVIDMPTYWVRKTLHIKSLKGYKNKKITIPVIEIYREFNTKTYYDFDSCSDSDSYSGSDSSFDKFRKLKLVKKI